MPRLCFQVSQKTVAQNLLSNNHCKFVDMLTAIIFIWRNSPNYSVCEASPLNPHYTSIWKQRVTGFWNKGFGPLLMHNFSTLSLLHLAVVLKIVFKKKSSYLNTSSICYHSTLTRHYGFACILFEDEWHTTWAWTQGWLDDSKKRIK